MFLRCLYAELQKCRRSPIWLAFVLLPVFPAILGTGNYLGNITVLDDAWYSLWSQHTLFSSLFFSAGFAGGVLRLAVAAGTHRSQLELFFHRAGAGGRTISCQTGVGCGSFSALPTLDWGTLYSERDHRGNHSPATARAAWMASLRGTGGNLRLRCATLFQPGNPSLCTAGSLWPGRRHRGTSLYCSRVRICFPVLSPMHRDAGQQSSNGSELYPFPDFHYNLHCRVHNPSPLVSPAP